MSLNGKKFNVVLLVLAIALSCIGCVSGAVAIADLPPESTVESPFEGTWIGIENTGTGPIQTEYQFRGNTYLMRTINPNSGNAGGWIKGVFTYTEKEMSLYMLEGLDPNYLQSQCRWMSFTDETGKAYKNSKKYTLASTVLTFGRSPLNKQEAPIKLPEEYLFFYNANNFLTSDKPDPFAFTVTEIDDQKPGYVNMAFLGSGYRPVELREPGTHKISFSQKYRFTDKSGARMEGETEGYFSLNFIPGFYEFSLYTPNFDSHMPANLPDIPAGNIRIVIMRTELNSGTTLYDYIDISTATPLKKR